MQSAIWQRMPKSSIKKQGYLVTANPGQESSRKLMIRGAQIRALPFECRGSGLIWDLSALEADCFAVRYHGTYQFHNKKLREEVPPLKLVISNHQLNTGIFVVTP